MSTCRQSIQVQANKDQKSGTVFHAAMKLLNRQPATRSTVEWIASDGYEFAFACVGDDKSLRGSLVRHWLSVEESGADVDLCIRELKNGNSETGIRLRLAIFAAIWHRARVMNSVSPDAESSQDIPTRIQDREPVPPAAGDLLELCEGFLTTHEEVINISETLLLRLYQHHDSYSAAVTSITASLQGL
ncbi:hypothetical protein HRR83_002581 [Exophiala dermatitidis]|nr:hypothetical protein HRR73_005523 [Exophiala dermatitidis]KAJ4523738.1 hypothetical protein HRR74_001931 [Exophiala dermatitidis]KAJ4537324.1 hypothetical protein HRR76_005335 [Exophiala dermatitidis]KAJ4555079.1 hypothetical protein HRR77_001023 [Exophiala dermatitidis]KAJ4566255.1 hypothetical protein HRR79_005270 [Exophiala dermatitidis]